MNSVTHTLAIFAQHNPLLVFVGAFVATILGGNIAAFIIFWVAFASGLGGLQVLMLFGAIAAEEFVGDIVWFSLGRGARNTRVGDWIRRRLRGHARVEAAIHKKGKRLLYLCKFAYGSAGVVLFSLGWASNMEYSVFLENSAMSILIALPVVFLMAYALFSGTAPLTAVDAFKHIELLLFIAIVAFFVLEWLISKAVKIIFANGENQENEG